MTTLSPWPAETPITLVAGTDYVVESFPEALLRLAPLNGAYARTGRVHVVYTQPSGGAVPPDVNLACTQTVAAWFGPRLPAGAVSSGLGGAAAGVRRYSVGQELTVELADPSTSAGGAAAAGAPVPAAAVALLAPYGYPWAGALVV